MLRWNRSKTSYKIEESLKELKPDERHVRRQLSVKPLVEASFAWLKEHKNDVPEKSATGKGIDYCLNREKYLRYFLEDGEVSTDNNAVERAIRGFCIRKNYMLKNIKEKLAFCGQSKSYGCQC